MPVMPQTLHQLLECQVERGAQLEQSLRRHGPAILDLGELAEVESKIRYHPAM